MTRVFALLLLALQAGPASAGSPPVAAAACLDPSKPYHAKWLSGWDVLVTAGAGKHRQTVRIGTNCIGIDGHARISVSAAGTCLVAGDSVSLRRAGEPPQTCRVTKVAPANLDQQASR